MRDKLTWFLLGAVVTGILMHVARRPDSTEPVATAAGSRDPGDLAQRLDSIDQRLAAIELRTGMQGSPATAASATGVSPPPRSPAQLQAVEASAAVVQRAIGAGVWSRRDAAEFDAASAEMRGEDRLELMRQLAVAINEDRVTVEPGVIPR